MDSEKEKEKKSKKKISNIEKENLKDKNSLNSTETDSTNKKIDNNKTKIDEFIEKNNEIKKFDLLFLIDATGSMSSYIRAAKEESENISTELRNSYPEYNFQYGYIFYRDPIDSQGDVHETIDLTDNVNSLPAQIKKIKAYGGGDLPEDWVGAYKLANEKISWRNGIKTIIHLADAGAHGNEFTLSDKYPEESQKLKDELLKCSRNKINIFGYVIREDARNSFNNCQEFYRNNGGNYEICDFMMKNNYKYKYDYYDESESSEEEKICYKKKKKKKKKKKSDESLKKKK
jgi:Mg-chelatase subunit ChlD